MPTKSKKKKEASQSSVISLHPSEDAFRPQRADPSTYTLLSRASFNPGLYMPGIPDVFTSWQLGVLLVKELPPQPWLDLWEGVTWYRGVNEFWFRLKEIGPEPSHQDYWILHASEVRKVQPDSSNVIAFPSFDPGGAA